MEAVRCELSVEEDAQNRNEEPMSNANGDSFATQNDRNSKHVGEKDDPSDEMGDSCAEKGQEKEKESIVDNTSTCEETTEQGPGEA